jgi:CubicO group peptidase (beta-lactamase class C family)
MTKPITSVALMQLWERGYFQLNDPVSRFVPEWKQHRVWVEGGGADMKTEAPQRPVSMRDMLMHTGGLTYGGALAVLGVPDDPHPVELAYKEEGVRRQDESLPDFLRKLGGVPLRYQPGERWMYSLSTDVCGRSSRSSPVSGSTITCRSTSSAARHDRHRLPRSGRQAVALRRELSPGGGQVAEGDGRSGDQRLSPRTRIPLRRRRAGGTTADYMRFGEALAAGGELDGKRILGPRTIELMGRNHLKGGADLSSMAMDTFSETANDGVGFGLGFATVLDTVAAGTPGAGDMYWGGAASTIFWVDPKEQLSVVFMTQLIPSGTFNFRAS